MSHYKSRIAPIILTMVILVVAVQSVLAYTWNAPNNWFQHVYQQTNYYCGPASAWMYINFVKNKYGLSMTVPSQASLFSYGHGKNISTDPAVDPRGEAWSLYNYTPSGYYYDDWVYDTAHSALDGSAYTIAKYEEPIIAATYHGEHFMVVRGVTANVNPATNYPNATISQVCVADPWDSNRWPGYHPTLGANSCLSASTWTNSYFTIFTYQYTVPAWTNHWVTVERDYRAAVPTTRHGSTVGGPNGEPLFSFKDQPRSKDQPIDNNSIEEAQAILPEKEVKMPGRETPLLLGVGVENDVLPVEVAAEAVRPAPISSEFDVISIAQRGIELFGLHRRSGFAQALERTIAIEPFLVESVSADFPDYYLVPFTQDGKITVVAMVGTKDNEGFYMSSTFTEVPLDEYPIVSEMAVRRLVQEKTGETELATRLVWKPGPSSWQPFYPMWEVRSKSRALLVDDQGQILDNLSVPSAQ